VKVLLHVQHRSIQQLTENGNIAWSTLYNQYLDTINNNPPDLLEQSIDYENEVNDNESQDEQIEEDEGQDEYRYD
jgi:hypothetical protein